MGRAELLKYQHSRIILIISDNTWRWGRGVCVVWEGGGMCVVWEGGGMCVGGEEGMGEVRGKRG